MLSKIQSLFYDPDRSSLYLTKYFLKFFGMWYPKSSLASTITFYVFYIYCVLYFISICFNLVINYNYELLINFVHFSSFYLTIQRVVSVLIHQEKWNEVFKLMSDMEKESTKEKYSEHAKITYKYKRYCQLFVYGYWIVVCHMLVCLFVALWTWNIILPTVKQFETPPPVTFMFYAWLPFDQNTLDGRVYSASLQTVFGLWCSIYNMVWDPIFMGSMLFLTGQLKTLRARCVHLFDDTENEQTQWENIVKIHLHHNAILKCSKLIDSLTSILMFIHFCQISTVCGICITKIVLERNSTADFIKTADILLGCLFESTLLYYVTNNVTHEANSLSYSIFESDWTGGSLRVRRAVLLLSVGMRKRIVFTAGPITEMSLDTLKQIFKASYSYYTLLSRNQSLQTVDI